MNLMRRLILFLFLFSLTIVLTIPTGAFPATSFHEQNGDWFDNFGIDRNDAGTNGELPGFLPNIEHETLGENRERAYSIGQQFLTEYPNKTDRAVAILKYVQTWTYYANDTEVKSMNGVLQEEWCQNADEFAHAFNQTTGVKAPGDCDCMATLCGTIYVAAGFDTALVDCSDHEAVLIWLPEFANANDYWDIHDGKGQGWIWVEATGSANPLGWTPSDFEDGQWTAYHITNSSVFEPEPASFQPSSTSIGLDTLGIIVGIIFIVIPFIGRLIRARSSRQWL